MGLPPARRVLGCSSPSPATMRKIKNLKLVQNSCPEGVWGPRLRDTNKRMCGAKGPGRFSHFDCAISVPRPPPDTTFVQEYFVLSFALYLGMDCYKSSLWPVSDEFIRFGAIYVTKPNRFMWFGDAHGPKTYPYGLGQRSGPGGPVWRKT